MAFSLGLYVLWLLSSTTAAHPAPADTARGYVPRTPDLGLPDWIGHSLAQYSSYWPVERYRAPPAGCAVDQVNIIQRHGARYPTASPGKAIQAAIAKLKAAGPYGADKTFGFIDTYNYTLGTDDLVPFGAAQSFDAGQEAFVRYRSLVSAHNLPFVRASDGPRVVASAQAWTQGFAHASHNTYTPPLAVLLSEAGNDTLDDNMCPNAGDADAEQAVWLDIFGPPLAARLSAAAHAASSNPTSPAAALSAGDAQALVSLCAFDSVARARASPWCALFTPQEFAAYEYYGDLNKYYNTGYGQPLGAVQGVGYVNELLARLTDKPVKDETQTNRTLDAEEETFARGRGVYADFSHDNLMVAVYAAMGLRRPAEPLDLEHPDARQKWRASELVPFAGRMVVERLRCAGGGRRGKYVRVLINERVEEVEFCGGREGVCSLGAFVESQGYAREQGRGDWAKCFEEV